MSTTKKKAKHKTNLIDSNSKNDIAIIGMSCKFPDANNYQQFWQNLTQGINSIKEITPDRFDISRYYSSNIEAPGKSISKWGGLLDSIADFDAGFFNISPREAESMDPQQRLLLQEVWHCLEDAGILTKTLQDHKTSVYVGVMATDYQHMLSENTNVDSYACLGNYEAILANRISYWLGLCGESKTIDTACSSSLVAIHDSRKNLLAGDCEYAIAAGVNVICHPWKYISFSKARMLSPDGQCKTFDKEANGYVPGEGIGVLLITTLNHALVQGHRIHGILKGSAVNHTGRSNSMTAPRVESQKEVIIAAQKAASITPQAITYIEAHGTGTSLGDPIEVEGLTQAFQNGTSQTQYCAIGSVKTNIGHLEAAAGVAGTIKVLLMMQHKKLVPTLNIKTVNPLIAFEYSPFRLSQQYTDWVLTEQIKRYAGVSSFGSGGVNAHVILEEYQVLLPIVEQVKQSNSYPFILSAKTPKCLQVLINDWQKYINISKFAELQLDDICHTLLRGREMLPYRLGFIVKSLSDIVDQLKSLENNFVPVKAIADTILIIGSSCAVSYAIFIALCKQHPSLQKHYNICCQSLTQLKQQNYIKKWEQNKTEVGKINEDIQILKGVVLYSCTSYLIELGFKPQLICGNGIGRIIAAAVSGYLSLSQMLQILLKYEAKEQKQEIVVFFQAPTIPFYNDQTQEIIYPFIIDADSCFELRQQVLNDCSLLEKLKTQKESLQDNQFTFKEYLEEWNKPLQEELNITLDQLLETTEETNNDYGIQKTNATLLQIILLSSIKKLQRKWQLTDKLFNPSAKVAAFVELVINGVLPYKLIISWLHYEDKSICAQVASYLQNITQVDISSQLTTLFPLNKLPIQTINIGDWLGLNKDLKQNLATVMPTFIIDQLQAIVVGKESSFKSKLNLESVENIETLSSLFLKLWAQGLLNEELKKAYSFLGKTVPLPLYPFSKEHYWISQNNIEVKIANNALSTNTLHQLIDNNISTLEAQRFIKLLTGEEFYLADHRVNNVPTLPGVAYIEMARAAGELASSSNVMVTNLRNIIWAQPISIVNKISKEVHISLYPTETGVEFEVSTSSNIDKHDKDKIELEPIIHAQGKLIYSQQFVTQQSVVDIEAIKQRCLFKRSKKECYTHFDSIGLQYGASFQVLQKIWYNEEEVLVKLQLPVHLINEADKFVLHPSILDGLLQSTFIFSSDDVLALPFSISELNIFGKLPATCYAHTTIIPGTMPKFQIRVMDETGRIVVAIKDFSVRALKKQSDKTAKIDTYYYQPIWKQSIINDLSDFHSSPINPILVISNNNLIVEMLHKQLPEHIILQVRFGDDYQSYNNSYTINAREANDYLRLLSEVKERYKLPTTIIYHTIETGTTIIDQLHLNSNILLYLSKALIEQKSKEDTQLICINEVSAQQLQQSLLAPAIIGFAKTLKLENPKLNCRVIETYCFSKLVTDWLLKELTQNDIEVRYTSSVERLVKTYQEISQVKNANNTLTIPLKQYGVYLITGGAGGLGFIFARYLAKEYKAKLILTGRSELKVEQKNHLSALEVLGAEVIYIRADITKKEEVERLLQESEHKFGGLNGIIHAAGVLRDSFIIKKTTEETNEVLAPKINGTIYLDELTAQNASLDFFILFSSITSIFGNTGQCNYAYANGFMDAFANQRHALMKQGKRYGTTIAINWPLWEEGGMQIDDASKELLKNTWEAIPLLTTDGVRAFTDALKSNNVQQIVLVGNKQKLEQKLAIIAKEKTAIRDSDSTTQTSSSINKATLLEKVQVKLINIISEILKVKEQDLDIEEELSSYGVDSISLTAFANVVNKYYKLELTPAILFEHATLSSFAYYLVDNYHIETQKQHNVATVSHNLNDKIELTETVGVSSFLLKPRKHYLPTSSSIQAHHQGNYEENIAIIGMSGIFPGSINLDSFWDNLANQRDVITEVPKSRWNWQKYYGEVSEDKTKVKWGGFIDGIDQFDAEFFNVSPREAELMDPQQRLFLQVVWEAIEDSGYSASELTNTGVFVGVASNDYSELLRMQYDTSAHSSTGTAQSIIANRISYLLNWHGPSEAVDTACSSSLVAIHNAIKAIHNGDCELAVAGGVNAILTPTLHLSFSKAGMLCEDGRCKTFDKSANGYVRGEGVGAILLKPLHKAIVDNDTIYAVIKGSSVNHGGHVNSLTVPNPNAQADLIANAIKRAQIKVDSISYIETHGTGTVLGDPIEVNGLKKAFHMLQERVDDQPHTHYCGLGTVKTNIGHLEAAAGIAGVIKVLLSMKYKQLPGIVHFKELNPYIELQNSPFYIVNTTRDWTRLKDETGIDIPRRAGISSFGFGGANAHVIVEEAPDINNLIEPQTKPYYLITMSAMAQESLYHKIIDLGKWITRNYKVSNEENNSKRIISLENISYTLNIGRSHFDKRCSLVVGSIEDLLEKLMQVQRPNAKVSGYFQGEVNKTSDNTAIYKQVFKTSTEQLKVINTQGNDTNSDQYRDTLEALANLYVKGYDLDWELLHHGESKHRISLPTYPFVKNGYWYRTAEGESSFSKEFTNQIDHLTQVRKHNEKELIALKTTNNGKNIDWNLLEITNRLKAINEKYSLFSLNLDECNENSVTFSTRIDIETNICLRDHQVYDNYTTPTDAYIELIYIACQALFGQQSIELYEIQLIKSLIVDAKTYKTIQLVFQAHNSYYQFAVFFKAPAINGENQLHVKGKIVLIQDYLDLTTKQVLTISAVDYISKETIYSQIKLGDFYQTIQTITYTQEQAIVKLAPSLVGKELSDNFLTNPSIIGGALMSALFLARILTKEEKNIFLPVYVKSLIIYKLSHEEYYNAYLTIINKNHSEITFDIELCDAQQTVVAKITGLRVQIVQPYSFNLNHKTLLTKDTNKIVGNDISRIVKKAFAKTLSVEIDSIDEKKNFQKTGLDSILGVEFIKLIKQELNVELNVTIIYSHPTIEKLIQYLSDQVSISQTDTSTKTHITEQAVQVPTVLPLASSFVKHKKNSFVSIGLPENPEEKETSIAIIGMSGCFPGADNVEKFWDNLVLGVSSIIEIPKDRWLIEEFYDTNVTKPNKTSSKWGGFIEDIDQFDPLFFNISPSEAEWMDPQQRLVLETAWKTLENAGYSASALSSKLCGIYVGVMNNDYSELITRMAPTEINAQQLIGNSNSILAARISYFLNLKGPAITIDTACSSSLVAIHLACKALQENEAEMMLAGGITLYLTETSYIKMSKARMLSPEGKCKTFDNGADGFVPGEGVGIILLKKLDKALQDKDFIYGVIKGSGFNQNGETNGITAPGASSQKELELSIYKRYGINPETISYIEAHGTGTKLGDSIEVEALTEAFRAYTDKQQYCAIGSVKTNIGHTSAASGVASVIKVLLMMKHHKLVPSLNFNKQNEYINFKDTPFYVNTELKDWETSANIPRRAAISSFGFSGTNAHMVLEEGPEYALSKQPTKFYYLLSLSAKHHDSLKQRISDLQKYLKKHSDLPLEAISYTLNTGRSHFDYRCALVVSSTTELQATLEQIQQGNQPSNYFLSENKISKEQQEPILRELLHSITKALQTENFQSAVYKEKLLALADLYIKGYDLNWEALHLNETKQKISLPFYPFLKKRYWYDSYLSGAEKSLNRAFTKASSSTTLKQYPTNNLYPNQEVLAMVSLELNENGIALICINDKANKNQLTEKLLKVLTMRFEQVANDLKAKVIVITGYDDIFSLDGGQSSLEKIVSGESKFTDISATYSYMLKCPLPVIAAIQGHAFGKGLVFGLYADIIIMSEDHLYSANFMHYGFTPGVGASLILQKKLSERIATEMIWTAQEFTGKALKERGAGALFQPGHLVLQKAMSIANSLIEKSSHALRIYKHSLSQPILEQLPQTIERELKMHAEIFADPKALTRVQNNFIKTAQFNKSESIVDSQSLIQKQNNITLSTNGYAMEKSNLTSTNNLPEPFSSALQNEMLNKNGIDFNKKFVYTKDIVLQTIIQIVADTLYVPEQWLMLDEKFIDLGVDSIAGLAIIRGINKSFELQIQATKLYDYPSINQLAAFIYDQVKEKIKCTSIPAQQTEIIPTSSRLIQSLNTEDQTGSSIEYKEYLNTVDIAVIGMSGRFPEAENVEILWENLSQGKDVITEIPLNRWSVAEFFASEKESNKSYSKWGGFLTDVDKFDAPFFNISPLEAEEMDPQQRLFLEESWKAFEDAGYSKDQLRGKNCGVFVGVVTNDYQYARFKDGRGLSAHSLIGNSSSILASRISYLLDLTGPSMSIDTACSSSLVAIHEACQSIRLGECDMSLAGGVNIMVTPNMHIMASQAGMLSPDGKCKTFDKDANGFVPAEGVGVIVLKKLDKALSDNNQIYAIIKGSRINQDGATNGITAPSARSQEQLEKKVYDDFAINPAHISFIETHGTGTKLGDPIEISALTNVFNHYTTKKHYCALGSVKTNIGHTLAAAGIVSVIKVLLCLKYKQLVPSLHFNEPTKHIDFANSSFYVNTELKKWERIENKPLLAAVSSFGFSGTNAHIVIEEAPKYKHTIKTQAKPYYLITLSAKTEQALLQRITDLEAWIAKNNKNNNIDINTSLSIENISYTLNTGRSHFDKRCSIVISSIEELAEKLSQIQKSNINLIGYFYGEVSKTPDDVAIYHQVFETAAEKLKLLSSQSGNQDECQGQTKYKNLLEALANLYVKGYDLDWELLHYGESKHRISLPTYPFAKERYWYKTTANKLSSSEQFIHKKYDEMKPITLKSTCNIKTMNCNFSEITDRLKVINEKYSLFSLNLNESKEDSVIFSTNIDVETNICLREHKVYEEYIMPTDAYIELVYVACQTLFGNNMVFELREMQLVKPLIVDAKASRIIQLVFQKTNTHYQFAIFSKSLAEDIDSQLHVKGQIIPTQNFVDHIAKQIPNIQNGVTISSEAIYSQMRLGNFYQTIQAITYTEKHASVSLALLSLEKPCSNFLTSPSIIDGALVSALFIAKILTREEKSFFLPIYIESLIIYKPLEEQSYTAYLIIINKNYPEITFDIELCDAHHMMVAKIIGLRARVVQANQLNHGSKILLAENIDEIIDENIRDIVKKTLADTLLVEVSAINEKKGFQEMGLDSILGMEFVKRIKQAISVDLDVATLYSYPTTSRLVQYLSKQASAIQQDFRAKVNATKLIIKDDIFSNLPLKSHDIIKFEENTSISAHLPAKSKNKETAIAIIGMSGRFPDADNIEIFWKNLESGINSVREIPSDRWNVDAYYDPDQQAVNKTYSRVGAFIKDVKCFEPLFFNISPKEAEIIDPQQRLFLEETWKALEDAGYADNQLSGLKCGVFVGATIGDYSELLRRTGLENSADAFMGLASSILASRISYFLNLKGSSIAIDTACSSSLVAIHQACESILAGQNDIALAGGVALMLTPQLHIKAAKVGMLSRMGTCRAFDQKADGIVLGEGVGVLVLKPLAQAIVDKNIIYGVIKGSGINQDGATNGITAPNPEAQTALELAVYEKANINPEQISYVETHGTGTPLGDPMELAALTKAFRHYTTKTGYCAIGSVKSNIGHTTMAAGVASVIKVLLALKNKKIPPSLNFNEPNRHIDFKNSPFYVNTGLTDWKSSSLRLAAVSSFGFSGTNAHIVIEEAPSRNEVSYPSTKKPYYLITLSAKTDESLRQKVFGLSDWLSSQVEDISLENISYTLNAGRSHFDIRCSLVVSSINALKEMLTLIQENKKIKGYFYGQVKKELSDEAIYIKLLQTITKELKSIDIDNIKEYQQNIEALANLYIKGYDMNWEQLHYEESKQKLSMPTYPFIKEKYWIELQELMTTSSAANNSVITALHSLIDINTSTLGVQSFSKLFTGREYYLADHCIHGSPVLPGVAYLEIARAAGTLASPKNKITSLRNIAWVRPLVISNATSRLADITLYPVELGIKFEIKSKEVSSNQNDQVLNSIIHAQGELVYDSADIAIAEPISIDIEAIKQRCTNTNTKRNCYDPIHLQGLNFGPSFQVKEEIYYNDTESLATLSLPIHLKKESDQFMLHPSMLDGALQTTIELLSEENLVLPFSLGELTIFNKIPNVCYAYATLIQGKGPKFNILIADQVGNVVVSIKDFNVRTLQQSTDETGIYYYHPVWQQRNIHVSSEVPEAGPILVIDNDDLIVNILRQQLSKHLILQMKIGDNSKLDEHSYIADSNNTHEYAQVLNTIIEKNGLPEYIVCHLKEKLGQTTEQLQYYANVLLHLSKALVQLNINANVQIIFLNEVDTKVLQQSLLSAAIAGFAKTLRLEHPKLRCKVVDVQNITEQIVTQLVQELTQEDIEVSYDVGGDRQVKTYQETTTFSTSVDNTIPLKQYGVYLITGGVGGLGLIFAKYLAENYQAKLILTGRSELKGEQKEIIKELKDYGSEIIYLKADISNKQNAEYLLKEVNSRFGKLNGIIHGAGVLHDAFIIKKTPEEITEVLLPKINGTINLDELTNTEQFSFLDFFILFSSIASTFGNAGQCDYAYANGFMDAFAAKREFLRKQGQRHGKTIAINWPGWEEGGMHIDTAYKEMLKNSWGITPLSTENGIKAFITALQLDNSQHIVLTGHKQKLESKLKSVTKIQTTNKTNSRKTDTDTVKKALLKQVQAELLTIASELLKIKTADLDQEEELTGYGFDSISFTVLINKINKNYKLELTPTILFEYNTLAKFAEYLIDNYLLNIKLSYQNVIGSINTGNTEIKEIKDEKSFDNPKIELNASLATEAFLSQTNLINHTIALDNESIIKNYQHTFLNYENLKIFSVSAKNDVAVEIITAGTGQPILFLSPALCLSTIWRHQFLYFSKKYQVVSIHYPGIGHSSINENIYNFEYLSKLIMDTLESAGLTSPIHLVGWSMGGMIAQHIASNFTDKLLTLTLVSSKDKYNPKQEKIWDLSKSFEKDFSWNAKKHKANISMEQIKGIYSEKAQSIYFNDYASEEYFFDYDKLNPINVPTMIIAGKTDKVFPYMHSKNLRDKIKDSEFYVFKTSGHYIPLFNHTEFNKKLEDFIKRFNKQFIIQSSETENTETISISTQ